MSVRPRILIIENSRHVTGAIKSIFAMTQDLADDFEFTFVVPGNSEAKSWIQSRSSLKVIELPMLEIGRTWRVIFYIPMLVVNALRLKRIIEDQKIDIVHSNDLYNLVGPMMKFLGAEFRYICHVRLLPGGFPSWLYNFWIKTQLSAASCVIAVSDVLKQQLPADPRVVRIYDRMLISSSDDMEPDRKGNILLYVANIIPGKGHDYAIRAFAQARKKFPSWRLRMIGGDMGLDKNRRYREQLKSMAIELQVADHIEWEDFTDNVAIEYSAADIFANFSSSESFSMTCLEAQYYGCCTVATSSGGPAEIIADRTSGLLIPVGDLDAMTSALEDLMSNTSLRESLSSSGARMVREKFSVANTSVMLRNVYMVTFAPFG